MAVSNQILLNLHTQTCGDATFICFNQSFSLHVCLTFFNMLKLETKISANRHRFSHLYVLIITIIINIIVNLSVQRICVGNCFFSTFVSQCLALCMCTCLLNYDKNDAIVQSAVVEGCSGCHMQLLTLRGVVVT